MNLPKHYLQSYVEMAQKCVGVVQQNLDYYQPALMDFQRFRLQLRANFMNQTSPNNLQLLS